MVHFFINKEILIFVVCSSADTPIVFLNYWIEHQNTLNYDKDKYIF